MNTGSRLLLTVLLVLIVPLPRGTAGDRARLTSLPGCFTPDSAGTGRLPAQCPYSSATEVMRIVDGLPAGDTIRCAPTLDSFFDIFYSPDGIGGQVQQFKSALTFQMQGTGSYLTYTRNITFNNVQCETQTGPRPPGSVQSFPTDYRRMQGQLPPGDPDFDLLRITAGSAFGMPSPGQTTLTQSGTDWSVDSFFDITYRIDFVGHNPGPFAGRSGSTTGTIRLIQGKGGVTGGSICGTKYEDLNGNGVKDPGEPPLSGWTIILGGANPETTMTDLSGNYCFSNLAEGSYTVREVSQTGWVQSAGLISYPIALGAGQHVTGVDFGNYRPPSIYGHKFNDLNGNGVWDVGEPAIDGWTICLIPKSVPGPEHTSASGTAAIDFGNGPTSINLVGTVVQRPAPNGGPTDPIPIEMLAMELRSSNPIQLGDSFFDVFIEITPAPPGPCPSSLRSLGMRNPGGNWSIDSFFDITYRIDLMPPGRPPVSSHVNGQPMHMTGVAGQPNSIMGSNAQMQDCQTGQPSAVVQSLVLTHRESISPTNPYCVQTDRAGKYCFMNIPPGTYNIREVSRDGWVQTTPDPSPITVQSGESISGVNFGNHDTMPPVITLPPTTWLDKQCEDNRGPFPVMFSTDDNSIVRQLPPGDPDFDLLSFFDVFTELSTNSGETWTQMEGPFVNSFFDVFTEIGAGSGTNEVSRTASASHFRGGNLWAFAPIPPGGYPVGTNLDARIRAIDKSGNQTTVAYGNITIVPRRPIIKPLFLAPFKKQFDFETNWYGKKSNSWCGPTAASSCLQRLGVPGLPTKDELVRGLAREMNTDQIAKNGAAGSGKPGAGTIFWPTASQNGFIWGLNKYLTNLGERNNYTIKVYHPNNDVFNGHDILYPRYPTYDDYKRELHNGEDVMIRIRYGPTDKAEQHGGHWLVGIGQIDGFGTSPNTLVVMDPATGDTATVRWTGANTGMYAGSVVTIKSLAVVSPKGNLTASALSPATHLSAAGSNYTPGLRVTNTHPFHIPKDVLVHCTIPATGYSSDRIIPMVPYNSFFDVFFDVFVVPNAPNSFFDIFYEIEYDDTDPSDDTTRTTMEVVPNTLYRTATMAQWAADLKPVKCKPDKVDFKFNLRVPQPPAGTPPVSMLKIKFNMPVLNLRMYEDKNVKQDTLCYLFSRPDDEVKRNTWTIDLNCPDLGGQPPPAGLDIQFDGRGLKGKLITVSYAWYTKVANTKPVTKGSLPNAPADPTDLIKKNQLLLPMPNLANVVYQIFEQQVLPADTGILIGVARPESAKVEGYLAMKKAADVLKTLNYKGQMHTGDPREFDALLSGKRILKKQASLPPNKYNNRLLAEAIALCLNIKAGEAQEKFPGMLGDLVIDFPNGLVPDSLRPCYDLQIRGLGRLTVREFADYLKRWFTDRRYWGPMLKTQDPICDSTRHRQLLLWLTQQLNGSFAGPLDTIRWDCGKLKMSGVADLTQVPFLHYDPSIPPTVERYDWTASWTPEQYHLAQNYPNPFNPLTMVEFELPEEAYVTLTIYNTLGQEVAVLIDNELYDSGTEQVEFDASTLPSGVYFYRMSAVGVGDTEEGLSGQKFFDTKKMMLIK